MEFALIKRIVVAVLTALSLVVFVWPVSAQSIELGPAHITHLPVAINIDCHSHHGAEASL